MLRQKHSTEFRNTLLKLHTQTPALNWWGNRRKPSCHHFSSSPSSSVPHSERIRAHGRKAPIPAQPGQSDAGIDLAKKNPKTINASSKNTCRAILKLDHSSQFNSLCGSTADPSCKTEERSGGAWPAPWGFRVAPGKLGPWVGAPPPPPPSIDRGLTVSSVSSTS